MIRMKEVIWLFNVSRNTAYKWISLGMPKYKVGKLLFFEKEEVIEWVKNHDKG